MSADPTEFIRSQLEAGPVPFVPEVSLYQAEEPIGLWELAEGEYHSDQPPPFWAFAWAGGQGLARYVLDQPALVARRAVLDLAAGTGLVGVAAALAGAASVRAVEIDPLADAAIRLNAGLNGVAVVTALADILDGDAGGADVVLAGDVFYSQAMSARMLTFLRRAARDGAEVFVGDPGRAYFPGDYFTPVAAYDVPVRFELESATTKPTTVWRMNSRGSALKSR